MSKKDLKVVEGEPVAEPVAAPAAPVAEESAPAPAAPAEQFLSGADLNARVPLDACRDLALGQTNHIHIPRESAWRAIAPTVIVIGVLLLVGAILWYSAEREKNLLQLVLEGAEGVV